MDDFFDKKKNDVYEKMKIRLRNQNLKKEKLPAALF